MSIKRDAADVWFSKCVRARDEHCLYCGRPDTLECCHIYGRRSKVVRWSLDNAVTLCHAHHRHFTENPVAFHDWLAKTLGEGHMEILREKARGIMKTDKKLRAEISKHYREELKMLENDPDYTVISYN